MEVSVSALADEDSSHTEAFVQCLDLSNSLTNYVPLKKRLHRIWEYQLDRRASRITVSGNKKQTKPVSTYYSIVFLKCYKLFLV